MSRNTLKVLAAASALAALTLGGSAFGADKVKIGFLLKTMQEERYQHDKADFIAKAEALGAEVVFDSANNDEQAQLSKFENMLSKGCKVIVLQPVNTGTAGKMVKTANEEKVKVPTTKKSKSWATTRCWSTARST